jgi:dephospho-CoA kinase
MSAEDARARIAAQTDDDARRAVADVWLDNTGAPEALHTAIDALWHARLVPFETNLRARRPVTPAADGPVDPDPGWAAAGRRLAGRVARAAGSAARGVAHVGPTAVPGLPAADVLDIQLGVDPLADPAPVRAALDAAGFPRLDETGGPAAEWRHAGADPGRPVRVHVRPAGSPQWRAALLRRDWLRADAAVRGECAGLAEHGAARHRWEESAVTRAEDWAASSGWSPSLEGVVRAGRVVS